MTKLTGLANLIYRELYAEVAVALKLDSIPKQQTRSNHLPVSFLLLFGQAKSKRTAVKL
jgi:hypothetical protein